MSAPVIGKHGPRVYLLSTRETVGYVSYDEDAVAWLVHDSTGTELPGRFTWFELEAELPARLAALKAQS